MIPWEGVTHVAHRNVDAVVSHSLNATWLDPDDKNTRQVTPSKPKPSCCGFLLSKALNRAHDSSPGVY